MTVTLFIYIYLFVSFNVLWSLIQAYLPDGYLGCFSFDYGEKLVEHETEFIETSNKGDVCKAACKNKTKRYAGTMDWWCFCGSGFVQNRRISSTECNKPCPGNKFEICGGFYKHLLNRISLYDIWLCITGPCQNGATCTDIDAESYKCSCSVGWTGRLCNETVATTNSTMIPSSSTQDIGSLTTALTSTTGIEHQPPSTQAIGTATEAALSSESKFIILIAVPVSIVVLIVFVLIVTVLILRKRANQNEHGLQAIYQTSANSATCDNDHNYDAINRTGDNDHNYYTIDQTGAGDRNYYNIDQTGCGDHNYSNIDRKV